MANDGKVESLVEFHLGELGEDSIALLLAYATSQERLSKNELDSFVIGMTREDAKILADRLMTFASKSPSGREPTPHQ